MRPSSLTSLRWLACVAAMSCGACAPSAPPPAIEPAALPLRIAAASDLQHVLPRLVERFQQQGGGASTITLDASGRLAEQVRAGAPFDVFMAANQKFIKDLSEEHLIEPESVHDYARGTLVLCVHQPVTVQVRNLTDLVQTEFRKIAIANPEYAPYGVAAKQALEHAGVWAAVESKIVRAPSVRQAFAYVQSGDADAALVSRSQAAGASVLTVDLDAALYSPLIQATGVVAASPQRDQAHRFVQFVMGTDGQQILKEAGFEKPPATSP